MLEMRVAEIAQLAQEKGAVVLALVVETEGSTPQDAGAAMLFWRRGALGTIGGGAVEMRAGEVASEMLTGALMTEAAARREVSFLLTPEHDQCCGGKMMLAFRRYDATDAAKISASEESLPLWRGGPVYHHRKRQPVYVYGAGHVGREMINALAPLDFALTWIDTRAAVFAQAQEYAEEARVVTPFPELEARRAPAGAHHIVVTHSHTLDLEIVAAIMLEGAFGFCGLIGSRAKRKMFETKLRARGAPWRIARRLVCPLGLPNISDKRPAAIAASTAAQLLVLEHERRNT